MTGYADEMLDEVVDFALHTASRATTGCYRPLLQEIGLTYTRYGVMLERTVQVSCTPAGRALQVRATVVHAQVESALGLTAAELAELRRGLQRPIRRLRNADGEARQPEADDPVGSWDLPPAEPETARHRHHRARRQPVALDPTAPTRQAEHVPS